MDNIENFGIITSISWNSNDWKKDPTKSDLAKSKYGFVMESAHAHEALNFGHEIYPAESDGTYLAYTPMFNRLPAAEKSRNVHIIFFISTDHANENRKMIVGCYGYPIIEKVYREAKHRKFKVYNFGNMRAKPKNIIYFDQAIEIDNNIAKKLNLLPDGKKIGQQGFNYINADNVFNILELAFQANSKNRSFTRLIKKLTADANYTKDITLIENFNKIVKSYTANTLDEIQKIESNAKDATPEVKTRVSRYIERGAIAQKVKKLTNFKCLICEQLKMNPHSFKKPNGDYYVEAHHVEAVSKLKKGSLGISNLITVCANHHRQLHYGNSKVLKNNQHSFVFRIDKKEVEVQKINLSKT